MNYGFAGRVMGALRAAKIRGLQLGIVVDNKDRNGNPGYRVKLKFPWLSDRETTFWARIAVPMAGPERGTYVLPEIDDQVLVVFEHGGIDRPIVVGALWSRQQEPVENNASGKNNTKLVKSRCGHRIIFDDQDGAEKITIVDRTQRNKIVLDSANKLVRVESDGELEVVAKANVVMHANALKVGTERAVTGTARSLLVHAQNAFGLVAKTAITVGGGTTTDNVSNAAATKVSGSGAGELGAPGAEAPKAQVAEVDRGAAGGGGGGGTGTTSGGRADGGGAGSGETAAAGGDPAAASPNRPVLPEEYQLECTLVTAGGEARPGVGYEIALPDGGQKTGTSGGDGVIRISGLLVTGRAKLVLPDVDAHMPDGWSSSQGIAYARGGVSIPVGVSQVSLPPAVYRGRMTGLLFETDKAFLLPSAIPGIRELKRLYDEHPGAEVMVSGHADREGPADYNLALSVERAEAIEAFLQDQVDAWVPWYGTAKPASKRWGVREDQHMLTALGHYTGPVHGRSDRATRDAVVRFRTDRGLGDGGIDDATRRALVEQYMATDGTTLPAGTKIGHHGCGEYHPEVQTRDGVAEPENRRVEVFLFEGPVDPAPPGSCPSGGCTQYPEWRKRTIETIDVNIAHELTFTLIDELGLPLKKAKVKIKYPDGHTRDATTDDAGTFLARVKPEDSLELEIDDAHEAAAGDASRTPSGTHFHVGGTP
jgi:outer membrane protein OmpA-like peptidoglycan-associated protein/phage baseplate assembly protein gpV